MLVLVITFLIITLTASVVVIGQMVTEEDKEAAIKLAQEYKDADDKEGFLIKQVDAKHEIILLWVARELGNFTDQRAIEALRKLQKHSQRDTEIDSVAATATTCLKRIEASSDLSQLREGERLSEQLKIVRKYGLGPNEYAREQVLMFLVEKGKTNPEEIVPLLVKFCPHAKQARRLILEHPDLAAPSLEKGLRSPSTVVVEGCVRLVQELHREEHLPQITLFLFADRDSFFGVKVVLAARRALRAFGNKPMPYLESVLYSWNSLCQFDAVADLHVIGTQEALEALRRFHGVYSHPHKRRDRRADLLELIERTIREMEEGK